MHARETFGDSDAAVSDGNLEHGLVTMVPAVVELSPYDPAKAILAVLNHVAKQLDEHVLEGERGGSIARRNERRHPASCRLDLAREAHSHEWDRAFRLQRGKRSVSL
ncbi:MAG: hypothetical protein U0414_09630 [Polyangiaceae bacterium]